MRESCNEFKARANGEPTNKILAGTGKAGSFGQVTGAGLYTARSIAAGACVATDMNGAHALAPVFNPGVIGL